MAGVTPDKLRQAANIKSAITTTTAEGAKDTTKEVLSGAAKGALTGGWVGAAKGAAVSFAKTKAGHRIIAGIGIVALVSVLAFPIGALFTYTAVATLAANGGVQISGEAATASGQKKDDVSAAMSRVAGTSVQWQIYLALTTVQDVDDIDLDKLSKIVNRDEIRTIGAAGVVVDGKGLTAGKSSRELKLAEEERSKYVAALTEYGLRENQAERVYSIALKWAFGEVDKCAIPEGSGGVAGAEIVTSDEKTFVLTAVQTTNAARIIAYASKIPNITPDAVAISLMAAMTESSLKNYANSNVPESLDYPHDAVGEDHDSVGFWQMRPHWGDLKDLMTIEYQVKAFFGGPEGPNKGSPRGLFDIPGWQEMTKAEAAQAVEVSAHPDRYAGYETLAAALMERYGDGTTFCDGGLGFAGDAGHPLGDVTRQITSPYGYRVGIPGGSRHRGIDFRAACNDDIFAIADGIVTRSGPESTWGNSVVIRHGDGLVTRSAHMPHGGDWLAEGTPVKMGDRIGSVGTTGLSQGCHLHIETIINGKYHDPARVLTDMGVQLRF